VDDFHRRKKSAAVLKHAIIDQYSTPFASKTGSTSLDHRVAFIDGYAGPGRYEDGEEGSGAMLLRKAHELAATKSPRTLELHFVEDDWETVARLRQIIANEGQGINPAPTVTDADIAQHLPNLLEAAKGIPLFVYLDPCGLIIPMDEVATIFARPRGVGTPATEVLINLTAGLRRFGGILTSAKPIEASLKRMDEVCGGDWWRQAWLDRMPDTEAAELAVVTGYAEKLREYAGAAGTWIIDVRPRADLKPLYYLIFATRHIDGMLYFGESASLGLQRWRRYHAELDADDTLFGDKEDWEKRWKEDEAALKEKWVQTLAGRITAELAKGESFRITDRPDEILGELAGVVRDTHLRAAINRVRDAKKTSSDPTGVRVTMTLEITPT
jgi:three-Cys-motif partner protein